MEAMDVLTKVRESLKTDVAVGEAVRQDGVTVVPVARVSGLGGGGGGTAPGEEGPQGSGSGVGFALTSHPVGVYVIKDGDVAWRPSVDVNKVIIGGQIVAVAALLTLRAFLKSRSAAQRRPAPPLVWRSLLASRIRKARG